MVRLKSFWEDKILDLFRLIGLITCLFWHDLNRNVSESSNYSHCLRLGIVVIAIVIIISRQSTHVHRTEGDCLSPQQLVCVIVRNNLEDTDTAYVRMTRGLNIYSNEIFDKDYDGLSIYYIWIPSIHANMFHRRRHKRAWTMFSFFFIYTSLW